MLAKIQPWSIVTHENDIVRYAHRVIRVLDGNIVEDKRQVPVIPLPPPSEGEEHEAYDISDMLGPNK